VDVRGRSGAAVLRAAPVVWAVVLAGCGGSAEPAGAGGGAAGPSPSAGPRLSGVVRVAGSSTVFPITMKAKQGFVSEHPDVNVLVGMQGTTAGFGRYLAGEADLVDASRAARPEEEAKAREAGLAWERFAVGYDGVTVVVNPTNDFVGALSVDQLRRIFEPGSVVRTWKDVDPSWPDRALRLYAPGADSGTFDFFTEVIVGKLDAQRGDVQTSENDTTLVTSVASDPDGLGYFGFAYYDAHRGDVKAVPIRERDGDPAVEPLLSSILDQSYRPLARPLYVYVKRSSMARPEVAAFVRSYLDRVQEYAVEAGYVPPSEADLEANRATLRALGREAARPAG
jgi:phosphate transport system substrate-binding protein